MEEKKSSVDILDKNGERVKEPTMWERLFFVERFYRRNRKKIIFLTATVILGGVAYLGNSMLEDYRANVVNKAYYNYKNGVDAENNLKIIEDLNPKLYSLILFSEAIKTNSVDKLEQFTNSNDDIISDLARYQVYSLKKDIQKLNEYSYQEGAIYKDLAIISEAYELMDNNEVEKAQNRLSFIGENSVVKDLANYLNHFSVVTKIYDASQDKFIINK